MSGGPRESLVFEPALNELIHELHDGAMRVPAGEFQPWALRRLQPLLPAGRWAWGVGCGERDRVHAGLEIGDPEYRGAIGSLTGRSLASLLSPQAVARPGVARFTAGDARPAAAATQDAEGLEICVRESLSGLFAFLTCTRRARQPPFSLAERAVLEVVAPHLFTAWRHARLAALHAQLLQCRAQSAAVVDRLGTVHVAESRFFSLLRTARPQWSGTRLPEPLWPVLDSPREFLIGGVRWRATRVGGDDAIVLCGTRAGALQQLTPGEARVATRIVEGLSYEQAAESLGISVNTLRNTLVRAYRRLGVRNKVELLRRLEAA